MLGRALCGAWILPLFLAFLAAAWAAPVQAQEARTTVVVLDFEVAPTVDPLWGRKAADAFAVELQRSGDFEVVTRQRVDEVRAQQSGLGEPFSELTQSRLGITLGATQVFSGRVVGVEVTPTRATRVRLEVKQLEATTGDFIEGTQVTQTAEQPLLEVANEILADEALNKAAYAAVRALSLPSTRVGTVLNTTRNDVELSIGARDGVAIGQRYSVLRDFYNPAKRISERTKIGEVIVRSVDANQSVATLSMGGVVGTRTGDRIRQIYVLETTRPARSGYKTGNRFNSRSSAKSNTRSGL